MTCKECEQTGVPCTDCDTKISPIPVSVDNHITGTVRTEPMAADYASYATYSFTGTTTDVPQRILGHDDQRARAVIQCDAAGGVYVGKKEQIASGVIGQGWLQKSTLAPLEIRNKQEVWVMSVSGSAANVMVLNERWEQ